MSDTLAGREKGRKVINHTPDLEKGVDVEGPVVAGCDGKALESSPGRVSQQGQQLRPCPSLLQHSCEEVRHPAANRADGNGHKGPMMFFSRMHDE